MHISPLLTGRSPNTVQTQTHGNGANTKQNIPKQPTPTLHVDPKKATQIDHAHRSLISITPANTQSKLVLTDLIVTPKQGERLSEQDRKDNSSLRN